MSRVSPVVDPRFLHLKRALSNTPVSATLSQAGEAGIQAAVSLVLRGREDLELLLIKRARSERDPWSGHMALPGGRKDPEDESLLATAVRETAEETAVILEEAGVRLGRLEPLRPAHRRIPLVTITPFVFGVHAQTEAEPVSHEVARTLWVPLRSLRTPTVRHTHTVELAGGDREFPAFRVGGEVVWGLTYRILTRFLSQVGSF
jgi:8-oxo-dGTP pyrophosphatase MutT (NUDIX family)